MKKYIIIFLLIFFIFGCNKEKSYLTKYKENTPNIYTSFYPMYFLTKEIVGDSVNVINIMPNSGEPHEYEPTAKQIEGIINSNFVVFSGLGIESYEKKLINSLKNTPYIILSEQLKYLISIEGGNIDPHTWLSPKIMKEEAILLSSKLNEVFSGKLKFDSSVLISKIDNLDKKYSKSLSKCKRKEFITSHKAFGYLARDYGLTQIAVLGISPEEEPSAKDIAEIVNLVKSKSVPIIYSEKLVSPKFTNIIIKETGAKVLELNPLETLTPEEEKVGENYISIMEDNLEKLLEGLDCK